MRFINYRSFQPDVLRFPRLVASLMLALAVFSAPLAKASTLEIQISGLDLDYDGTNIFDGGLHNTVGIGSPAESDALSSMSFYVDNILVGSVVTADIFADLYIANVQNIPAGGGLINSAGNGGSFGVDLLTQNNIPGWGLALNIDTMQFFYTGSNIAITVSGLASSLYTQNLPFGLAFDANDPITIVFSSANLTNLTTAGGFVTGFDAAGTGNVAGTALVPEPGTLSMLGLGMVGLLGYAGRRFRRS